MMDKTLHIDEKVHKRLSLYKAEGKHTSMSLAIEALLDE